MKLRSLFILSVTGAVAVSACSRSTGFKKDQEYYNEPPSYYNKGGGGAGPGKSPTQKVESMGQPKKRVMVLGFWNDTPVRFGDLGNFAADELKRGLFATQRIIVPTDTKTDLTTEDLIQGDTVKVAQLIREGRRLGVSILIIGRVTKIVFRQRGDDVGVFRQKQSLAAVETEIKMFDVGAGREIMAAGRSGEASSNNVTATEDTNQESQEFRAELSKLAIRTAVTQLIPDVVRSVEKLQWQGHVAKIVGNKIYVNAGKASGLVAGDILKILTQGEDIYDPASGAYLGRTQGQLKGTIEVNDFLGTDGAVGELHTGGNFQEGDIVRLY